MIYVSETTMNVICYCWLCVYVVCRGASEVPVVLFFLCAATDVPLLAFFAGLPMADGESMGH